MHDELKNSRWGSLGELNTKLNNIAAQENEMKNIDKVYYNIQLYRYLGVISPHPSLPISVGQMKDIPCRLKRVGVLYSHGKDDVVTPPFPPGTLENLNEDDLE